MQGEKPTSESSFSPLRLRWERKINSLNDPLLFFRGKAYAGDDVRPSSKDRKGHDDPIRPIRPDVDVQGLLQREICDRDLISFDRRRPYFLMDEIIGSIPGFTDDVTKTTEEDADT